MTVLQLLRRIPYFAGISETHLQRLAEGAIARSFSPGQVIYLEGDEAAGLWILEEGRVKAYKLAPDGQEYILRFYGPNDIFNDLAVLDHGPSAASTMAITEGKAWVIPAQAFTAVLEADHELCMGVIQGLAGSVRELLDQVEELALRPITARLARFLLEQAEDPTLAHPAVTRALIARHLATTPETISRSLRALEKAGALRFDRHRIIIVDPEILRQQAEL